jgi:glycosyltransferase 2 family protein
MTATTSDPTLGVPARGHFTIGRHVRLRIGHVADLTWLRRFIPMAIGVAALAALILGVDPNGFRQAINRLDLKLIPAVVAVSLLYYLLQGVRWQGLLEDVGIHLAMGRTVLLNLAGQATALLPLGELTRAVLVSEAASAEFGSVVATVTVQELIYTMVLIVFAVPGLLAYQHAFAGVVAALVLTALIFLSLTWCPAYKRLRWMVAHTPGLRRFLGEVDQLHNDTVLLFRRRGTLTGSWISAVQAACAITTLWLVAEAVAPGAISWERAAVVFAISNVAGALSLIPGGIGAYEASVVGILVSFGMNPGVAAAVALLQRLADKGLATGLGFAAYAVARRRLGVSGLGTVPIRPPVPQELRAA